VVQAGRVLQPADVTTAAAWAAGRFAALAPGTWEEPAPGWTRRRTLDHLVDTLALYAACVGTRATARLEPPRDGDPAAVPARLLEELASGAARLADLLADLTDGERAFHPSGSADCAGWIGMACTELLVHTWDAAGQHADPAVGPLAAAVVARVLPWAPDGDGWSRLLQATGRASLGDVPPAGPDWWWQSEPLDRWDGRPRRRTSPPQW
jgi:uncharacterized protein (TIGR03083 family)